MTKKLTALLLALILCVGLLPTAAFAGEPKWVGGDPNCTHEHFDGTNESVDDENHLYTLTCLDCGAKGYLPFDEPQPHNKQTSEITAGSTGFPYGGTIEYCDDCGWTVEKPNLECPHPSDRLIRQSCTPKDNKTHIITYLCGVCEKEVTAEQAHDLQTFTASEGDPMFPSGTLVDYCGKCNYMGEHQGSVECTHPTDKVDQCYNDTGHWYECTVCGQILDGEDHVTELKFDDTHHWHECTVCPWASEKEAHVTGYLSDDNQHWQYCQMCDWKSEKEDHNAVYDNNSTQHWGVCNTCSWTSEKEGHTLVDQGIVDGKIHAECECGYGEDRDAPDLSTAKVTGLKGEGEYYTESEAKRVGLEGLTEGADYTRTVQIGDTKYVVVMEPVEGKTVGKRTVELNKCPHTQTLWVDDGAWGHIQQCLVCQENLTGTPERHELKERTVDNGDGTVSVYNECTVCPYFEETGTYKDLSKANVTGLKGAGEIYTEEEAKSIGPEGLTEGVDYTRTVTEGEKTWIVTLEPVEGKSVGKKVIEVDKCLHDGDINWISDGEYGHHKECAKCGADLSQGQILPHDTETVEEDDGSHVFLTEKCKICPWTKDLGQRWKLDKVPVTGLKGAGEIYTEEEAKSIGLEGLTEGVDYTRTVTEGEKTWIVTLEPVEGKSVGKKVIEVDKCLHDGDINWISDGEYGHHKECAKCGADLSQGQILPHDTETVEEDDGSHVFLTEKCKICPWTKDLGQRWKLDKVPVTGLKGAGEIYTEEEAKSIGLEGLTEGVEYTRTVTSKVDNDGGESWVVKLGPVEGKSVQEVEVTVRKSAQHEHLLAWVTDNEQNHWQVCTVEGCRYSTDPEAHAYAAKLVTAASCTQDAAIQMECKCGRVDPNGRTAPQEGDPAEWFAHHTWSAEYESDFWEHWRTCTVCHVAEDKQPHALTNVNVLVKNDCITNGSITADCSVCGKKDMSFSSGIDADVDKFPMLEQYKALGHDFSGPVTWFTGPRVCTEEGQGTHAPTCVRCNAHDDANQTAHAWAGLHTVQNGSCDNPNDPVIQEAECECGATLHIEKQREHVWVDDKSQDVQATCLEPGKINGQRCMICGTFGNYDFVPALGHDIQIPDQLAATCEKEGYIHRVCSRGDLDETEILKTLSPDGHHHFEPLASQAPTCTTEGKYSGEKCKYCPATQAGETGYGIVPALGHKVVSRTASHGKTRTAVGKDGRPIEMQVYVTTFSCSRCGASLGGETFTVATSIGKLSGQYRIEPGVVTITDMENGIHVKGNMSNDGGVYFNGVVQEAYEDVVKDAGKKYTYKKVETKSFIIEFTDEFLSELEDGEYEMVVINGSEYWPMMVTVRDHKFKALRDVDIPDMPELTEEEFDALLKELSADGEIIRRFFLNQPVIMPENDGAPNENGDIVVVKSDGDYVFESLVNGDYTLEADKDYTIEEDTVTIKADYLSGVPSESEIVFHYAEFGMEGAPLPHEPKLPIQ